MANKPVLSSQQQSAFNNALQTGIQEKDMDVIRLALDNGAEPNLLLFAGISYKPTLKDKFSLEGSRGLEWVKTAVDAGADVRATKKDGKGVDWEAIHWAQSNFDPEISDFLIGKGALVDKLSPYNDTPLMNAVTGGRQEEIRYYLDRGADPMCICGENKDTFPLKALQASDKFKPAVKKDLLLCMMQKAKDRAATATEAEASQPADKAGTEGIEICKPLRLKHAEESGIKKISKIFSL
ncbi:MAG: ankyrin repeat domain-containing protein [Alphaproteobacteria bacterium]|nr:MAG: ankyrin repeat domain-containing protein [Alphaproteobacteria bacterium]